jgi:Xaa-Pro aminopeptidase
MPERSRRPASASIAGSAGIAPEAARGELADVPPARAQPGRSPSSPRLVTGERLCYPHDAPRQRVLRAGDGGNIELGAAFRHDTATLGRNFQLGRPPARLRAIHEVVREAGSAMIAAIRPGVPAIGAPVFLQGERLGARLIDNVIVTATGAEPLSEVPREIIEIG